MAATLAGHKRKRDEGLGEDVHLKTRIGGKIHHEKKLVHKACKKAKVFEIQKVVQRLKNERNKNAEDTIISDYETQLSCLKMVNDDAIGNSAFRSKILKDHLLRGNEAVLSFVTEFDPLLPRLVEAGSALAKIQSRLLSSRILSAQVAASVESLRVLVDPSLKVPKDKNPRGNEDVQPVPQKSNGNFSSRRSASLEEDGKSPTPMADDSGWESGTVDIEDRIVDESDLDSDYGSSRSGDGSQLQSDFEAEGETESDEDVNGSGHGKVPAVRKSEHSNKIKKASSSIKESTFLPSLSVGFIQGSDDSDFNEAAESRAADMPKKNRRGQRARRAIWEKKYGLHANHKKKEAEEHDTFAKKTTRPQMPNVYNAQPRTTPRREGAGKESNNIRGANPSKSWSKDDKPLHPSWEAKRKQKDKERGNIVPGQGKKIKF